MPNLITVDCPIDGLALAANLAITPRGDVARDANSHLHLEVDIGPFSCLNGHTWSVTGMLTVTRR